MADSILKPIIITPGEPAGIGPDIVIQCAQEKIPYPVVVIADPELLYNRAKALQLPLRINEITEIELASVLPISCLNVFPISVKKPVTAGELCLANSAYVMQTLDIACQYALSKQAAAIVTGPVHKQIINAAGYPFLGHTQYFAQKTQTKHVVMFFMSDKMRVALVTDHVPLQDVSKHITEERLGAVLEIVQNALQQLFSIAHPRLAICGLNPHAGEGGYLGSEEQTIIIPVLDRYRQRNYHLLGPLSADSAFTSPQLETCDALIAMYHDQGLTAFKHSAFGQAVNITLGLPILRTSVDHGTALTLAGTTKANYKNLYTVLMKTIDIIHASAT